ncbi:hypothetical protein [Marixanthomonas ophiurae]|uniref:Uncharacterized protein n=1 Tax=Marixanthomonas ophiurae TaxID=387659 RepID=A0A3E1Q907_9FLAO|nr:hypothetical protein [Marixanthomonas ophiurae]RFN58615.1 hypothetical protein DZ858_00610 [Marixanthomonas ophiurae]
MNEFYSLKNENSAENKFQLTDLGNTFISAIIGKRSRTGWGESKNSSQTFFREPTEEDYNRHFANKIMDFNPTYEIEQLLEFHFKFYTKNNPSKKETFLKHIKYIVLPIIKGYKNSNVQTELVEEWLVNKMGGKESDNFNFKFGDINSPAQFQINSNNSVQKQNVEYSNENVKELFELIKKDLKKLNITEQEELKYEIRNAENKFDKGKDIHNRLLIIGDLIKDIGIGVFTSLVSSPLYEIMKPLLGI